MSQPKPPLFVGGPFHGQWIACDLPQMTCRLPDPHDVVRAPLMPPKPDCLEQREIEALTGRSYRREPGPLLEDFERSLVLQRTYTRRKFSIRTGIPPRPIYAYVFEGLDDKTACKMVWSFYK